MPPELTEREMTMGDKANAAALRALIGADRWELIDGTALTLNLDKILVQFTWGEAVISFDDPFSGGECTIRVSNWSFGTLRTLLSHLECMITVAGAKREGEEV